MPTPVNNDTRPPEIDAMILKYEPGLKRLAYKLSRTAEDAHDLYIDTIIKVLVNWEKLRENGGPWLWMQFMMRGLARDRRDKGRLRIADGVDVYAESSDAAGRTPVHIVSESATQPAQHHAAELSEALRNLTGGRDSEALMRYASGDMLHEIGADMGVGKERVRQLIERERVALRAVA